MLLKNFKIDLTALIYAIFAVVGGFLEVYTFVLHGGVFCNAQTGNVVMLVLGIAREGTVRMQYIYSILAYLFGIVLTAVIPDRLPKINWPMTVTVIEILAFVVLAALPAGASDWYTYATVSFLCAVQYNTFTRLHGNPMATTFCTNNLRQMCLHFVQGVRGKERSEFFKSGAYLFIIVCFAMGVALGATVSGVLGNWCILVCAGCLLPVLVLFIVDFVRGRRIPPAAPDSSVPPSAGEDAKTGKEQETDGKRAK